MPSVTIVEDHLLLTEALTIALTQHGVDVAAVAPAPELLARIVNTRPDLVMLDLNLGAAGHGERYIAPLVARGFAVLVVTGIADRWRVAAALEAGAVGYQPKEHGFTALLTAAMNAISGATVTDSTQRHELLTVLAQHRAHRARALAVFATLTEREQAALRALSEGYQVREIAAEWVVSEATVRTHVRGILTKLGVSSQLAAVALARRRGWLREQPELSAG